MILVSIGKKSRRWYIYTHSRDSGIYVLGHNVAAEEETAGHILSIPRITLYHLASGLEAFVGNFVDRELFMIGLLRRDDRSICG